MIGKPNWCRANPTPIRMQWPIRRWKRLTVYTRAQMEEILVSKLIATSARQIGMFLVILAIVSAAIVGKIAATFWAPVFPKYVLLEPGDAARGFVAVVVICVLASVLAIHAALKVDPAEAIGG